MMQTSPQMRRMIAAWEGLRLTAYRDVVGVWTIGYGHTGPDVTPGLVITQEQAEMLLASDLQRFERGVSGVCGPNTIQSRFDALVSFSYNLGLGALQGSTLLRYHLAEQYPQAAGEFLKWDHAGGQVLEGLLERRQDEAAVYLTGTYS